MRANRTICLPIDVAERLSKEPQFGISPLIADLLRAHYARIDQPDQQQVPKEDE